MTERRRTLLGFAAAMTSSIIAAGFMVTSRLAVTTSLSAFDMVAIRIGVAGLVLLPLVLRRGLLPGTGGWPGFAFIVVFGGAPYLACAYIGFAETPAAQGATIMAGSTPLWTALFAWLWQRIGLTSWRLTGLGLLLAGTLLIGGESLLAEGQGSLLGKLMIINASLMFSVYNMCLRVWSIEPFHGAAVVCVVSMLWYLPVYVLFLEPQIAAAPWQDLVFHGVYQGILTQVIAFSIYGFAMRSIGPASASSFNALIPGVAAALAYPLLGEAPDWTALAGMAVVTFGILLAVGWRPDTLWRRGR